MLGILKHNLLVTVVLSYKYISFFIKILFSFIRSAIAYVLLKVALYFMHCQILLPDLNDKMILCWFFSDNKRVMTCMSAFLCWLTSTPTPPNIWLNILMHTLKLCLKNLLIWVFLCWLFWLGFCRGWEVSTVCT